jgi:hypothetical protein
MRDGSKRTGAHLASAIFLDGFIKKLKAADTQESRKNISGDTFA